MTAIAEARGDGDDSKICAICCEDTASVEELARPTVCQHLFCRGCLEQLCRASRGQRLCPLDRKPFNKIVVVRRQPRSSGGSSLTYEATLDAATLVQLQRLFDSPEAPAVLGFALLVGSCAAPGWLLAVHALALAGLYYATDGIADWTHYHAYLAVFYALLAPVSLIGPAAIAYACVSCSLVGYCGRAVFAELASGGVTAEKLLFAGTAVLVWAAYPMLLLSVYSVLQVYCYMACLIVGVTLHSQLSQSHGPKYVRSFMLFSGLFFMPYICQLQQLSLPHLLYACVVLSVSLYCSVGDHLENEQLRRAVSLPSGLACSLAPAVVLGFSPWTALYCAAALDWASVAQQQAERFQRVRQLLAVNIVMVMLLLPWILFGLMSYQACLIVVLVTRLLTGKLVERIDSMPNRQVVVMFYHWAALGILAPMVLF